LNIVRNVDAVGQVEKVFRRVKVAIQPELFLIIGPPSAGKSTLARRMTEKYNLTFIDVEKLIWEKNVNNQLRRISDDDGITKKVLLALEQSNSLRFLIEGFPMNLYQLKKFETAFGSPKKLFNLALFKEELQKRSSNPNISLDYFNYVSKAGSMIDHASKKGYFSNINVNLPVNQSFEMISKEIEPEIILLRNDVNNHLRLFLESQGYQYFNLNSAMKSVVSRQTERGKELIQLTEAGKIVPARLLIKIMQEFIYSGSTFGQKFCLGGVFPSKLKELELIENHCVRISKAYHYTEYEEIPIASDLEQGSIDTFIYKSGRLLAFHAADNYKEAFKRDLDHRLDRKQGKYILFIGSVLSGKSTQAKKFSEKTGFKLVNYEELPDIIKAKKSTEEEPYEKVTFEDILEEIFSFMRDPLSTIILDGLPPESQVLPEVEVSADDEEVKDRSAEYIQEAHGKLTSVLGSPYLVFHLSTDLKALKPRLFKRLELTPEDDLNEDQVEILTKSLKLDQVLLSKFKSLNQSFPITSSRSLKKKVFYEVNTNLSESRSFGYITSVASPKLIIVEEMMKKVPSLVITNISMNNDVRHIHVPDLLIAESLEQSDRGELVKNLLNRKVAVPTSIIVPLLQESLKTLRFGDQVVIVTGLFYQNDPNEQPRTMELFMNIEEKVAEIVAVILVAPRIKKEIVEVDQIPVVHYPPPKKEDDEPPRNEEEDGEEQTAKPPEIEYPPRSSPGKPVNLPKIFQLYKRGVAKFLSNPKDLELEDAIKMGFAYVAGRKYLSMDDQERFSCPNIQLIV
jgi:adenylate kinase family enzyme